MTTVSLYPDQTALVDNIVSAMRAHKSVLVSAATGFGKTRVAAHMIDRARLKGKRVGFVVPRIELLKQTVLSLDGFGIPFSYFASGYIANPFAKVWLMSGPTLALRIDKAPALDVIFVDETHYGGAQLDKIIRHYKAAGSWVIGLSATPYKTNGQGMGEWYDVLVNGPSVKWLMHNGRLSKYQMFAPDRPDLSALRVGDGDYVQKDVDAFMMSDDVGKVLVGNAAAHYHKLAPGSLAAGFCTSVAAAHKAADQFTMAGIPSRAVSGKMDDAELRQIMQAYARREIKALFCAQLLEFGWDLSQASGMDVCVESEFDLCPSKSMPRVIQRWGRVLRYKPYPAIMCDHVGNVQEHGLPDDDREWSLEGRDKKKRGAKEPTQPVRQCPTCYFVHRPTPCCPQCGFVYPVQSRMIEEVDGELVQITERIARRDARMQQGRADTLESLMAMGKSRGNAMHILRARAAKK